MGIFLTQHHQFLAEIVVRAAIRIADRCEHMVDVANVVTFVLSALDGAHKLCTRHVLAGFIVVKSGVSPCGGLLCDSDSTFWHIMPSFLLEERGNRRPKFPRGVMKRQRRSINLLDHNPNTDLAATTRNLRLKDVFLRRSRTPNVHSISSFQQ